MHHFNQVAQFFLEVSHQLRIATTYSPTYGIKDDLLLSELTFRHTLTSYHTRPAADIQLL